MTELARREIRALHDMQTITVYQAYRPEIAEPAAAAGRFGPGFKRDRMTWIKPSFLWMMYRSGWAGKAGQERVLAIRMSRDGFAWALTHAALSSYEPHVHASQQEWKESLRAPVRIQWDPERDLHLRPLAQRTIQIGLSGVAVDRYVDEWTAGIEDVTAACHEIRALVAAGELAEAALRLPAETPYPLVQGTPGADH